MIGYLSGKFLFFSRQGAVVNCHGVGYLVHLPSPLLSSLKSGSDVEFFILTHVREDALTLFGFRTQEDMLLFEHLISVSGIGPKTALAIMSQSADRITGAIAANDVSFFTSIPGIGKKNAQKLIIELKNKVAAGVEFDPARSDNLSAGVAALTSLGFSPSEASAAFRQVDPDLPLNQQLKLALKNLNRS